MSGAHGKCTCDHQQMCGDISASFGAGLLMSPTPRDWLLELVKPIPGLIDAPLLWQAALSLYLTNEMKGQRALLDENYFFWPNK
eukprot:4639795-Pyramimonas_sp.AAC.1